MTHSSKALTALVIAPNLAWVSFVIGLGLWRTLQGQPPMMESTGSVLVGVGVFLAIACPVLASYLRPRALAAARTFP